MACLAEELSACLEGPGTLPEMLASLRGASPLPPRSVAAWRAEGSAPAAARTCGSTWARGRMLPVPGRLCWGPWHAVKAGPSVSPSGMRVTAAHQPRSLRSEPPEIPNVPTDTRGASRQLPPGDVLLILCVPFFAKLLENQNVAPGFCLSPSRLPAGGVRGRARRWQPAQRAELFISICTCANSVSNFSPHLPATKQQNKASERL